MYCAVPELGLDRLFVEALILILTVNIIPAEGSRNSGDGNVDDA